MFIKKNTVKRGNKTYITHLLVESVSTPAGPRHKVICSLGKLDPGPKEEWLALADRIQAALGGQPGLFEDPRVDHVVDNTERFFGGRTACVRRTARSAEGSRSWTKPGPVTNRYGFSVITGARFDPLRGVRLDPGRMKSG